MRQPAHSGTQAWPGGLSLLLVLTQVVTMALSALTAVARDLPPPITARERVFLPLVGLDLALNEATCQRSRGTIRARERRIDTTELEAAL